jgi:methyl-accepting chemotaxis protein
MKNIRRRYLIDKEFQIKYILYPTTILIFVTIIICAVVYLTTWFSVIKEFSDVKLHQDLTTIVRMREYEGVRTRTVVETIPILKEEAKMLSKYQLDVINKILVKTNTRVVLIISFILLIVFVSGIFITHRIAGPLFRINRELDKMIKGDLDVNFKLRKRDELKPLSNKLQLLAEKMKIDKTKLLEVVNELKTTQLNEYQKKLVEKIESIIS